MSVLLLKLIFKSTSLIQSHNTKELPNKKKNKKKQTPEHAFMMSLLRCHQGAVLNHAENQRCSEFYGQAQKHLLILHS